MPVRSVADYLDRHHYRYHSYNHPPADRALDIAHAAHVPDTQLAKTVILNADGELIMAVLPANQLVDRERLRRAVGAIHLRFASEDEFRDRFPQCETGGEPPLGKLYGMPVYLDDTLARQDWIAFNAGTHTEIIKMDMATFREMNEPVECSFTTWH
jgi:Ala-tRNA(Pro) deacylase